MLPNQHNAFLFLHNRWPYTSAVALVLWSEIINSISLHVLSGIALTGETYSICQQVQW